MVPRAVRLLMASLAALTLLAGCGGGGGGNDDGNDGGPNNPGNPITVAVSPTTATVAPGGTRTFTATVTDTADTRVTWTASGGTITTAGVYTAPSTPGSYVVRAASVADPSKVAGATVTVRANATQALTVTPPDATIPGGTTQQFTATATGFSNPAVTWTATGGTVSATGLYTAPNNAGTYVVRATSVEDPSFGAEARVTVTNPVRITPALARIGSGESVQFSATLPTGAPADVNWSATGGTISATGLFTASTNPGTSVTITATLRSDPTVSASVTITIAAINVTITPTAVTIERGATYDFDATVTGAVSGSGVTWTTSAGTIDANGLLTAPATGDTVIVTATSVANPARSASATVTLTAPLPNVTVTVGPSGIQFSPGGVGDFDATVVGATDTSVVWSATGGTIDSATGTYTAGSATGNFEVRATSVANPNRSAAVVVRIDAIPVNVTPRAATLVVGANTQFTATVGGAGSAGGVTWTTTGGTISQTGRFTATGVGTFTITVTSRTDATKSNTATVTVTN